MSNVNECIKGVVLDEAVHSCDGPFHKDCDLVRNVSVNGLQGLDGLTGLIGLTGSPRTEIVSDRNFVDGEKLFPGSD